MKIRQLSDLHLETGPFTWEDQGEDVVVLAERYWHRYRRNRVG